MTPQELLIEKQEELINMLYQKISLQEQENQNQADMIRTSKKLIDNLTAQVVILKNQLNTLLSTRGVS
jgi:hypothetical protein